MLTSIPFISKHGLFCKNVLNFWLLSTKQSFLQHRHLRILSLLKVPIGVERKSILKSYDRFSYGTPILLHTMKIVCSHSFMDVRLDLLYWKNFQEKCKCKSGSCKTILDKNIKHMIAIFQKLCTVLWQRRKSIQVWLML